MNERLLTLLTQVLSELGPMLFYEDGAVHDGGDHYDDYVSCRLCYKRSFIDARDIQHAADCPVPKLETLLREEQR